MSFDCSLDIISILTFLTIIVIIISVSIQYKQMKEQLKIQNEQLKQNHFSEYTKRYQDIVLHFPENINKDSFSYEDLNEDMQDKTMRYMRVYFDLCSEEYFLYQNEYIDRKVWEEWEDGMGYAFNKKAFRDSWEKISKDSNFYKEFKNFVNDKIKNNND